MNGRYANRETALMFPIVSYPSFRENEAFQRSRFLTAEDPEVRVASPQREPTWHELQAVHKLDPGAQSPLCTRGSPWLRTLSGRLLRGNREGHRLDADFVARQYPCGSGTLKARPMPLELQRVMHLTSFADEERTRPRLRYWLSRPPAERVAAVEFLRGQVDGSGARLRRVHRILDCPWR